MLQHVICMDLNFHPVGQGLFSSGHLFETMSQHRGFHWVYDCGTSSKSTILHDAMLNYETGADFMEAAPAELDLVAVSHFDSDHISGLVSLLGRFRVRTLLLPYMHLGQRLEVAFSEHIDSQQSLMRFFLNPVRYLLAIAPDKIGQIVFVPGSSGEAQPFSPDVRTPAPWDSDGRWTVDMNFAEEPDETVVPGWDLASLSAATKGHSTQVQVLQPGAILRLSNLWEFVPYNDIHVLPRYLSAFQRAVNDRRNILMSGRTDADRSKALGELKGIYDHEFGKSSRQRNIISLFLYAGPVAQRSVLGSILYTGDGYLDSMKRLRRLQDFLGNRRMEQVHYFQVMHHGAEDNWFEGLARHIKPLVSVFSADPHHRKYGHPNAAVLRDFLPYQPVLADKTRGQSFHDHILY